MHPFRQPPEPPPPPSGLDEVEALFRKQLRRRRQLMIGLAIAGLMVVVSPFAVIAYRVWDEHAAERRWRKAQEIDDGQRREVPKLLARADAEIAKQTSAWKTLTARDALLAHEPGLGRCVHAPTAPTYTAAESYMKYGSIDGNYFGSASYTLVVPGESVPLASAISSASALVERVRKEKLDAITKSDFAELSSLANGGWFDRRRSIVILVEEQKKPVVHLEAAGMTYDGGLLRGRAIQLTTSGVECAADIEAESSTTIDVRYWSSSVLDTSARLQATRAALERDLEIQTRRALAEQLRTAN